MKELTDAELIAMINKAIMTFRGNISEATGKVFSSS